MAPDSILRELEIARGATFSEHAGSRVLDHFGNPEVEYRAMLEKAGVLNVSCLGKLRVTGRDRVRYLNNMLSNDIKRLTPGQGCYSALLTHQGRMESDLHVHALPEELRLECPAVTTRRLLESLQRFIIADVVVIEDCTERLAILSLQGPDARGTVEKVVGISLEGLSALEHRTLTQGSEDGLVVQRDRTGQGGYDIWLPMSSAPGLWRQFVDSGIPPVGHRALNLLRTEAGIPWYGEDMDDRTLPMEVGLFHAISMTKGCYRGQEIVARVTHRGHLDRGLGGIAVDHADPPPSQVEVRVAGARVGEVTSSVFSPRLGKPLALAILKNSALQAGTGVELAYAGGVHSGEVVALPLK